MKIYKYGWLLLLVLLANGCKDDDLVLEKEGVRLPPVTDLQMEKTGEKSIKLSWGIPAAIPEGVEQPLNVFIEVFEILGPTRAISVFNTTLANAPTQFMYEVPDPAKTYHITVKLNGLTKVKDINYSGNIFSDGQTVIYQN